MNDFGKKSLLATALGLALTFVAGAALAGETCDPKDPKCEPPPKKLICHNIGGPRDLGANCDMTGTCTYNLVDPIGSQTDITLAPNFFLGIVIGNATSVGAVAAHLAHGDGYAVETFKPAYHLASADQNHQAANVECVAERAITTQPPEPGN